MPLLKGNRKTGLFCLEIMAPVITATLSFRNIINIEALEILLFSFFLFNTDHLSVANKSLPAPLERAPDASGENPKM